MAHLSIVQLQIIQLLNIHCNVPLTCRTLAIAEPFVMNSRCVLHKVVIAGW